MALSIIHAQRLGHEFWVEAVCNVMYMCNMCPTRVVEGKTAEEAWIGRMPHISYMLPTKAIEGMTLEEAWIVRMPHVSYMLMFDYVVG